MGRKPRLASIDEKGRITIYDRNVLGELLGAVKNRMVQDVISIGDGEIKKKLDEIISKLNEHDKKIKEFEAVLEYLNEQLGIVFERLSKLEPVKDSARHSETRMTSRQKNYIMALLKDLSDMYSPSELKEMVKNELGVYPDEEMSREDASKVIEFLKKLKQEKIKADAKTLAG